MYKNVNYIYIYTIEKFIEINMHKIYKNEMLDFWSKDQIKETINQVSKSSLEYIYFAEYLDKKRK